MDKDRTELLRAERIEVAASVERAGMRKAHGPGLVEQINASAGLSLLLEDFGPRCVERELDWPRDIRDSPGLVAAYVDKATAEQIVDFLSAALGLQNGYLGFHEAEYLGFARVRDFSLRIMLEIATSTSGPVLFYSEGSEFVLLVDSYGRDAASQYSVVLQGESLGCCEGCFQLPVQSTWSMNSRLTANCFELLS